MDQGGKTADKVDSRSLSGPVQSSGEGGVIVCPGGGSYQGNGSDGDALVDDGDTELLFDGLPCGYQLFGITGDLVINVITGRLHLAVGAGEQGDAHGNGTHIQMLLVDHLDGLHNFMLIEHS